MNWARIISELGLAGISQRDIADLRSKISPLSQPTVSRWANGTAEPSWSEAVWLLELHSQIQFSTESLSPANPVAK